MNKEEIINETNATRSERWIQSTDLNITNIENSIIAINNNYIFDVEHIEFLVNGDFLQNTNVRIYHPNLNDMKEITEWLTPYFNDRFVLVTDNNYIYAIQYDLPYNFNSDVYDFKEGDRRLKIKYVIQFYLVLCT
jgi:hypothetical protein